MTLAITLQLAAGASFGQSPIALTGHATEPIESPDISESDVELFGQLASVWEQPDGTQVIQYQGDFALHLGRRRLTAEEAVIWMSNAEANGRPYLSLDVFLYRNARVREPAGTVTRGDQLYVTLKSFGKLAVLADRTVKQTTENTPLYRAAEEWRRRINERGPQPTGTVSEPPSDQVVEKPPEARQPVMIVPGERLISEVRGDERVVISIGGVYLAQGAPTSDEFLEIRADNAVLYAPESTLEQGIGELEGGGETEKPAKAKGGEIPLEEADIEIQPPDEGALSTGVMGEWVTGAYLEGDVVISRGERVIRSPRVYYDFETNRALILDATMSTFEPTRKLPLVVRADQIRQLSSTEYEATNAKITTSEFHTPHYHIGADEVYLQDRTAGRNDPTVTGLVAGTYRATNTTLNVESVPILYWPYSRGDFKQSESVFRSMAVGYSDDFGAIVRTNWYLANLLGAEEPEGFDTTLHLDYLSDRGPAAGVDVDYLRENYYGLVRSYYINDHGTDDLGAYRQDFEPATENRYRFLWRHRQYLPKDWELTFEISSISDPTFLQEYFEREFEAGKKQETVAYLKKQVDNWAIWFQYNWRLNYFQTQTEHLPEVAFNWEGQPIGDYINSYSEGRAGFVKYRLDDRQVFDYYRLDNLGDTDAVGRLDLRQEFTAPFSIGPVRVSPFASVRGSYWEDTPHQNGSQGRFFGTYGARANMYFSRLYDDVRSELFDLNGMRHVIEPEFIGWYATSNVKSVDLTPFDEGVETIDDFSGVVTAIRQRFQTKRGGPGEWRTVDWLTLDLEAGFFSNTPDTFPRGTTRGRTVWYRPENSIARNYLLGSAIWRISDSTALLGDINIALDTGRVDSATTALAVQRTPRFSYFVGWAYVDEIKSNLLGYGFNYQISQKHTLAFRNYFDLDLGRNAELALTYIRKWPRWYTGLTLEIDDTRDTVGIALSIWPEGAPQFAVGAKQYADIASSTAISD